MDPIILLDDTTYDVDVPMELDTPDRSSTEPEFLLESVDALIQRANVQFSAASSKIETASAARVPTFTVQATREMEAAIGSVTPIDVLNVTDDDDDDVIFVGERGSTVINLCSPDKGARTTSTLLSNQNNGNPTVATASIPHTDGDSHGNTVMCAICMESSVGRQPHSTKCGHIFCGTCIKEAIKITRKCPLCNKCLNVKNIMPVFI